MRAEACPRPRLGGFGEPKTWSKRLSKLRSKNIVFLQALPAQFVPFGKRFSFLLTPDLEFDLFVLLQTNQHISQYLLGIQFKIM